MEQQNDKIYSVKEIGTTIKLTITKLFTNKISIQGESSNVKLTRGNLFFTLKDNDAAINIMFWDYSKKTNENIEDGEKIIVTGKLSCYIKSGTVNFICDDITKLNDVGDLHKTYENTKKIFLEKGYFDNGKKKNIPNVIKNIGIITSKDGAAIQDVLYVLNKNNFKGNVYIKNCIVQGNGCPISVMKSIEYFKNNKIDVDVLLITRGGGAFEDLMGFSDEIVIDTIYNSDTFIMSAVGHEVDNMLSDFVADYRAPTPSVAAEVMSSYWKNIGGKLDMCRDYILPKIKSVIDKENNIKKNKIENIRKNVFDKITKKINEHKIMLTKIKHNILSVNYDTVIETHRHLILDENNDFLVDSSHVIKGQKLKIKIKNKIINVTINNIAIEES